MNVQDMFYYIASAGILVSVVLFAFLVYQVILTLKDLRIVIKDVEDTTHDVAMVKNGLKAGILSALVTVLGKKRGGEAYG
jgi:hypothetical protein